MIETSLLDKNLDWFNADPSSRPMDLKGQVTVLYFWTSCCINCMHVLPDVRELEGKYRNDPVLFIGIHSPKFDHEKELQTVQNAILKNELTFPVISDSDLTLWNAFQIRSWPSFVILSPDGHSVFTVSGEGNKVAIDEAIAKVLLDYPLRSLNRTKPFPRHMQRQTGELSFPGKVAVDSTEKRLFISDSGNHRILIASLKGEVLEVIGSPEKGFLDGSFSQSRFYFPQGIVYHNQKLYVADAENHAIREIDLLQKTVATIAGNGKQGRDYKGGAIQTEQALSSPWDAAISSCGSKLFIAMAGTHQIWIHDLATRRTRVYSGSGVEQNVNSDNLLLAAWAKPSGIAIGDGRLYIADSESSAIRAIDLNQQCSESLAGGNSLNGSDLFCFGDLDGQGDHARLQHPLGISFLPRLHKVIIADTYNHRIKMLDPKTNTLTSLAGKGVQGYQDGPFNDALFNEPSGLCFCQQTEQIFSADTNNHKIRVLDLSSKSVETLPL